MKFNQFDNNTSDFFMRITNGGNLVDIEKAIVVLAIIKPSGKVASQFVEVENGLVYADLKPSMKDEIGTYTAQAMLILEDERVVTDAISYEVEEDKIFSLLNDSVRTSEEFTLLTDMLSRLSTIETNEEQRVINEAERILSEENRKIEEVKRVEAELIRQHEEADRAKYDATRESNENIRKQNESIRLANETNRIDEEAKRVEEEANRVEAEQLRKDNYNFMTEDEDRRRLEANAHKEAEVLRVQAETNRVNEEAKRRTTEQARVSAENIRVSNENVRKANEEERKSNETQRVEAETQRKNRYNSFISDAETNTSNFENYTNTAKVKEEERKSNELDRKLQEDKRVSNEVERISNENTRKANEKAREKNETSRQYVFENKVDEVDKKIIEINTTKDNFVSSINTKVDTKISELNTTKDNFVSSVNTKVDTKISEIEVAKSDMTNTVSNKVDEVETRFNALTSSQQQDAEVIDARDGETSLKARLDRDIEKANKELDKIKKLEESTVSTVETESDFTTVEATSNGYFEDVKLEGKTLVNLVEYIPFSYSAKFPNIQFKKWQMLKPSTEYTFVLLGDFTNARDIFIGDNSATEVILPRGDYGQVFTFTTPSNINEFTKAMSIYVYKNNVDLTETQVAGWKLLILEGDHTQNPPSYFEGLKSVGDGIDEVSVESVNENLFTTSKIVAQDNLPFLCEPILNGIRVSSDNALGFGINLKLKAGNTYYFSGKSSNIVNVRLYRKGGTSWSDVIFEIAKEEVNCASFSKSYVCTKDIEVYFRFWKTPGASTVTDVVVSKTPHTNPIRGEHDKKRLLYYNNETQTWEKPILRQWDSIEKHTDGKYYYHVRSIEEDYVEGDESLNDCITDLTVSVKKLAEEKVYECTNIDLITYANETNYIVNCGAIVPKTTLKVHNNISNVVSLLQKKVSLLESNITSYMITQNRLMLASRYNADNVTFKVDYPSMMSEREVEIDYDLFKLIQDNIIVGPENYDVDKMLEIMDLYAMIGFITWEMWDYLYEVIDSQINPVIGDLEGAPEI